MVAPSFLCSGLSALIVGSGACRRLGDIGVGLAINPVKMELIERCLSTVVKSTKIGSIL